MNNAWIREYDILEEIFRRADLVDLIAEGAPMDEYDLLALEVFTRIKVARLNKRQSLRDYIIKAIQNGFSNDILIDVKKVDAVVDSISSAGLADLA